MPRYLINLTEAQAAKLEHMLGGRIEIVPSRGPLAGAGQGEGAVLASLDAVTDEAVKLIIRCQEGLVAEIPDYTGPIPRAGEYIEHPPLAGADTSLPGGVMPVKTVTYTLLARSDPGPGFTRAPGYTVEVFV